MWQNQLNWPVSGFIMQTDTIVSILRSKIDTYVAKLVKLTVCGNISQTDPYVAIQVKLTHTKTKGTKWFSNYNLNGPRLLRPSAARVLLKAWGLLNRLVPIGHSV